MLSFWISPAQFPRAIADMHERFRVRGRSPSELIVATEICAVLADTTEEARRIAAPTMRAFDEALHLK